LILENKIKEFQKNKKLVSDGIVGSKTYEYLNL
jgi:murein L,D-transpeptidase YcbB/YkuD